MYLLSLAFVWAALLGRVNAALRNVSFGPSSPQVRLLPSTDWNFVNPEDRRTPQYAFTAAEGAQAIFTFPRACLVGQHAPIAPRTRYAHSNHLLKIQRATSFGEGILQSSENGVFASTAKLMGQTQPTTLRYSTLRATESGLMHHLYVIFYSLSTNWVPRGGVYRQALSADSESCRQSCSFLGTSV